MLAVQERELEAAWFIKRIHYRIVCVFSMVYKWGYRKSFSDCSRSDVVNSASVSTTILVIGDGVGP